MNTRGSADNERRKEVPPERSIFTSRAVMATLWGDELRTVNDDTCDGHGSHRGSPRHENGGRHYKSYGAALPAAV